MPKCHKTHTFELVGLERNKTISNFVVTAIKKEFYEIQNHLPQSLIGMMYLYKQ